MSNFGDAMTASIQRRRKLDQEKAAQPAPPSGDAAALERWKAMEEAKKKAAAGGY